MMLHFVNGKISKSNLQNRQSVSERRDEFASGKCGSRNSFYETVMGFRVTSQQNSPIHSAILARDNIKIGLAENGGDPTQEGCFFEVDNAETAFAELKENGLERDDPGFRIDQYGDVKYKVFFVIAPDGLCYCLGERQN
jgi:hypothetical protein